MPEEPDVKRAISFIGGQNLFRHAKDAFGHYNPNYDPRKLSNAVCEGHGWINHGVRFYTGIPGADRAPMWHGYWTRRLTAMRRAGIAVISRPLRYRVEQGRLPDRSVHEIPVEREKGIDLRLGLDVVRLAHNAVTRWTEMPSCRALSTRFAVMTEPENATTGLQVRDA